MEGLKREDWAILVKFWRRMGADSVFRIFGPFVGDYFFQTCCENEAHAKEMMRKLRTNI